MFKKLAVFVFSLVILAFLGSCFSYKKNPRLHYYRGPNVPAEFINIVRATPPMRLSLCFVLNFLKRSSTI